MEKRDPKRQSSLSFPKISLPLMSHLLVVFCSLVWEEPPTSKLSKHFIITKHYKTVSQYQNFKDEAFKMLSWLTVYANRKPLVHNPYPSTRPSHVNCPPERKIRKKNSMSWSLKLQNETTKSHKSLLVYYVSMNKIVEKCITFSWGDECSNRWVT